MAKSNAFQSLATLKTAAGDVQYHRLQALEDAGICQLATLPFSIRVLLEAALRNVDDYIVRQEDVLAIARFGSGQKDVEIPFLPGRVLLQDFTGVPCVVDLAAMRDAMKALGGDPAKINPLVPCDLVIDHSVQVDYFGTADALQKNVDVEFDRNRERYEFLKWGQQSLHNFRAVPPAVGIVHQVNLEYLASVALTRVDEEGRTMVFPDSLVGTDSHTTMINGLGVLGWGVGGIEAEAVMLGQPVYMLLPEVVGFELKGALPAGATATDLVLTVTQLLRKKGVVNKFVEFHGSGVQTMSLADRATIANMAPEYGATMGFFPVDAETLRYLIQTGRSEQQVQLVKQYYEAQGLFVTAGTPTPKFSENLSLDLSTIEPSLAGPKRPQDRVPLNAMASDFSAGLKKPIVERGYGLDAAALDRQATLQSGHTLRHGSVVIAAITSCTNTSNPSVMIGAGLLARNAVRRGLTVKPYVKTSLAPGSRVVTDYLQESGLQQHLDSLGFQTVGYGCTTCIGNSGPLPPEISAAVLTNDLVAASVLSGNRNFEGRVNPDVKANFLASPPLVVAYALAGTVTKDLTTEPLGKDAKGVDVYLKDIWPDPAEVRDTIARFMTPKMFRDGYAESMQGPPIWQQIEAPESALYPWLASSTYIQNPPYFEGMKSTTGTIRSIRDARVLVMVGDSVTTDHISPAGAIKKDSPAGRYLLEHGVAFKDFNSYGARRGNDRVMTRGTFANIRLRNLLAPGTEGGVTRHLQTGEVMSIFDAAMLYQQESVPLVVLAGKEYGTGSSRDWAAKGTFLLGVRIVLAESYERIHRSNLVGMGVMPLQYLEGQTAQSLGLSGEEYFSLELTDTLQPRQTVRLQVTDPKTGAVRSIDVRCRIDTPVEIEYFRNGGILHTVLRKLL